MCVCARACVHACVCVHVSKWENKLCHVIAEVQKLLVRRFFSILACCISDSVLCYFHVLISVLGLSSVDVPSDSSVRIFV